MENRFEALADQLMVGAYDLHLHSLPSVFAREMDGVELLREADQYGMAGVMLKSHYEPTALRAALLNKYSGCRTKAYGGLVLNWPVGGLNIYAVDEALEAGAKIIWMPTRDSANSLCFGNMPGDFFDRPGIAVIDENDALLPEVLEIMDAVKKKGAWLATGHISPKESVILCREGRKRGVNMILTHPEFDRTVVDRETQKELAALGVKIEKCWFNIDGKMVTAEEMAETIRQVGHRNLFMCTDRGQKGWPTPPKSYRQFILTLLSQGITEDEIYVMSHEVPEMILTSSGS